MTGEGRRKNLVVVLARTDALSAPSRLRPPRTRPCVPCGGGWARGGRRAAGSTADMDTSEECHRLDSY
ncbi:hypothetical protein QJS66_10990 [Kocuria rhizophila]|nr:hypothetical protein QJS66_10990 [Kocuria rhizophila]